MRQDVASEDIDVVERELGQHRPDLEQHHEIAEAQSLDDFLFEPLPSRRGIAGEHGRCLGAQETLLF
jgi:hypothetical protein